MIEHLEIRQKTEIKNGELVGLSRKIIGIIDDAINITWSNTYYGVGDFEIDVSYSEKYAELLVEDNLVTRPDDDSCGIIKSVNSTIDSNGDDVIHVKGVFIKQMFDQRNIYKLDAAKERVVPTTIPLSSSDRQVQTAVWDLIRFNCINSLEERKFYKLKRGPINEIKDSNGNDIIIVDENGNPASKQVTYTELLTYTDELLEEYGLGSKLTLDKSTLDFVYEIYQGKDRSYGNNQGNIPIMFSQDFDSLLSSNYERDKTNYKNVALVAGEGEEMDRKIAFVGNATGYNRYEMVIDASSISQTVKDENGIETRLTDKEYFQLLVQKGKQDLSQFKLIETFSGELDLDNSIYKYKEHYNVGDIVTIYDTKLKVMANVRILKITESQSDIYKIVAEFSV